MLGGIYPVLNRRRLRNWYRPHLECMCWSVIGLYAALVAEIGTRFVAAEGLFRVVGLAVFTISMVASLLLRRFRRSIGIG